MAGLGLRSRARRDRGWAATPQAVCRLFVGAYLPTRLPACLQCAHGCAVVLARAPPPLLRACVSKCVRAHTRVGLQESKHEDMLNLSHGPGRGGHGGTAADAEMAEALAVPWHPVGPGTQLANHHPERYAKPGDDPALDLTWVCARIGRTDACMHVHGAGKKLWLPRARRPDVSCMVAWLHWVATQARQGGGGGGMAPHQH